MTARVPGIIAVLFCIALVPIVPLSNADATDPGAGHCLYPVVTGTLEPIGVYTFFDSWIEVVLHTGAGRSVFVFVNPERCGAGSDPIGEIISTINRESGSLPTDPLPGGVPSNPLSP